MKALFDRVVVINLPARSGRLKNIREELLRIGIKEFEVFPAIEGRPGAKGLFDSLFMIYKEAAAGPHENILILEDDARFLVNKAMFQTTIRKCLLQLEIGSFDLLYLGVNTHQPFEKFEAENLLKIQRGYATHAMVYSRTGIQKILEKIPATWSGVPIDVLLSDLIQVDGNSYCTYPLLATQRKGFSDIEFKQIDYSYIEERFTEHTKHLIQK